jgi:hypothetical protein
MRRISIVPLIAAAILVGHVAPHLLLTHQRASNPIATFVALPTGSPAPLVVPTCRLQAPPTADDREPMLAALRQLIARDDQRYPYLADNSSDVVRRFEPCGVGVPTVQQ